MAAEGAHPGDSIGGEDGLARQVEERCPGEHHGEDSEHGDDRGHPVGPGVPEHGRRRQQAGGEAGSGQAPHR